MITFSAPVSSALSYSFCGQFVSDDPWIHPVRIIDTYEVLMPTQGEVYMQEDGTDYHLMPNDLILLRPGVQHGGTRISTGRTAFFWGHFSAGALEPFALKPGLHTPPEPDRLISAFRCLLHVSNAPQYPAYASDAAIASLLAEVSASQAAAQSGASRLAHEAAEWIRINCDSKLSVQEVARHFRYHPDYLCTLMKSAFGKSLKEYLCEARLQRLKTLLLTTDLSVKELAGRMNFDSESQLIHFFKYHEGISPTRYRNQYARTHMNRQ